MDRLERAEARIDGRNIDRDFGRLQGEASQQRATDAWARPGSRPYGEIAAEAAENPEGTSYYGLPVLAEPVWRWMIPAYFFVGGLAGASAVLGGAVQLAGGPRLRSAGLIRRCRMISIGGAAVSAVLLIADLGRPARFLNMLRVFRPTSPMNMGTWVLTGFGACSGAAALPELLALRSRPRRAWRALSGRSSPRWLSRAGDAGGYGAAVFGLPLVGYTGVLLANTAVPVWQQTRNTLPVLFAFSGAVSAGAALDLWAPRFGADVAHRFGLVARGAELAASAALDLEASPVPRVARPLRTGLSGALLHTARALMIGSLVAEVLPVPRRTKRIASGAMALLGTLALRFGIVRAGHASARDPHATFEMQRAGRGAAEVSQAWWNRLGAPRRKAPQHMPTIPGVEPTGKESVEHASGP